MLSKIRCFTFWYQATKLQFFTPNFIDLIYSSNYVMSNSSASPCPSRCSNYNNLQVNGLIVIRMSVLIKR